MAKTSRKTKKTWVKNIDLDDIEQGVEAKRDRAREFGDDGVDQEFVIDESASDEVIPVKKLKSTEILTNKSKIPALQVERNQKPKSKNITRLMKIAGRIDNSTSMSSVDKNGLVNAQNKDIWGEEPLDTTETPAYIPERLPKSKSKVAKVRPDTITRDPIKLDYELNELHPGKSYNPSLESWKQLVDQEFGSEQLKELDRQKLVEKQELLIRLLQEEEESSDEEDDDNDDNETNDNDSNDPYKLSINKPTENKKKTKTQRNKLLRQQKRDELQIKLKELKQQINEITQLDLDAVNQDSSKSLEKSKVSKPKHTKAPKKLFKYKMMEKPMEVKLSDELNSNLKNLRSEGNLFYSNMLNLQAKGLIENRVPIAKKSKYKPKITEKWTYKDFK